MVVQPEARSCGVVQKVVGHLADPLGNVELSNPPKDGGELGLQELMGIAYKTMGALGYLAMPCIR